ncbi:hypothetical protein U9M48_023810 [Paspalum notatum var. saurae]|uniref:Transposase-associated domain-containing protein n=1 Tax=Paspalum notatum var. saurae TaxID=547442 RepID=A0AAQ3WV13_PASNO
MSKDQHSVKFLAGLGVFIETAEKNKKPSSFISCPCFDCKNEKEYSSSKTLHNHLIRRGFMSGYVCWTKHGELGVLEEEEEEEKCNIDFARFNSFADTLMGDADDEDSTDALAQMLHDANEDCDNERDWKKLERMLEDHRTLLYPNYKEGHMKLHSTLELLQWKASNGVSDKGFNELLMLIEKLLLEGNKLPATTYEATEVICPLGLEVQKIHACPNDCILYRGDYRELECCQVCKASRYKIKRDDPRDVEGERPRKRVPAKVMWYFPIIPRLRRLFRNKEHAKTIRWHKEERKKDDMLRHLADGSQWRKIDRTYLDFAEDARNIRFDLSTDGMNPFSEMSSSHSTWPVTLCMYNLPPWLCLKQKFIMMPALIQGPKQPGNDIDVYLQPLVEELLLLRTEVLDVCHTIDMMHVTKNLCVNLLGFLRTYGKNKDTLEARDDMAALKGEQGHHYLGTTSYTLSKREKESMFECLDSIKIPSGYSCNVRRIIKCKDKKFVNIKSHDCHVLMTQLLPVVLRGILLENIDELKPIGVTLSCYEGRLAGKGTLGKKWVKLTAGGVMIDPNYGITTVDLNNTAYRDEPFVLAADVTQVFYVKDMSTKP